MGFMTEISVQELKRLTSEQKKIVTSYFMRKTGCAGIFSSRMKDDAYEASVKAKISSLNIKKRAFGKIGLDESQISEIKPVCLEGFEDYGNYMAIVGRDGKWRSSAYRTTWIFFSSTQVYFYSYIVSMISDTSKENVEEYFYKDITNFSTSTKTVEAIDYSGKKKSVENSEFALIVPGDKMTAAYTNSDEIERSIQAMKQKLREKKNI